MVVKRSSRIVLAAGAALAAVGLALAAAQVTPAPPKPGQDAEEAARIREYFELADHDRDGWISFEEASVALGVDRDGFARFDTDRDGRVTEDEFSARYRDIVSRGGVFVRPRGPAERPLPPLRTSDGLLSAYDSDLNGALSRDEIELLLGDYRLPGMSATLLISQYDTDGSGRLERSELEYVATLLSRERVTEAEEAAGPKNVTSLEDLFGEPQERPRQAGTVPLPPRLAGPVRPFTRLDVDRDGLIDVRDLDELQFPLTLAVRPATVIAALDRDGDGALSAEELRNAFEAPAQQP